MDSGTKVMHLKLKSSSNVFHRYLLTVQNTDVKKIGVMAIVCLVVVLKKQTTKPTPFEKLGHLYCNRPLANQLDL